MNYMLCWGGLIGGFWVTELMERVKEAAYSEVLKRQGPTHTYRDSLERPHSVPMQLHLGSEILCLASTLRGWVQSSWNFYVNCGESVQPLQSVKMIY